MERFSLFVNQMDAMVWSMVLVILCLGVGLYLSIRLKFPQIRLVREMVKLLTSKEESENGITPFQAFATTVGARVGMGNIAGVASAIFYGGPGSVFWMWMIAVIGAASAFVESALAQAYKVKSPDGEFTGGPAYYIEKGLKCKPYAILFAVVAFLGPGFLMPGVQINSLVTVFEEAFSVNKVLVGAICCIVLGIVVYGSIKRIAHIAEMLAPAMCAVYILAALIVVGLNITKLPGIFLMIIQSAFGVHAVFGGILGSAVSWGVKRGIYSNEAGMGCGAIVSAAAECSHPVKQGLIQAFSIYVDTLFIGTSTALIVLLTGTFDVIDGAGNLLISQTDGIEAGIKWTQHALMSTFGTWSGKVLAIIIVLFVFTSMTGYCYQAESNIRYLTGNSKKAIAIARAVFLVASFLGAIVNADAVWAMGDIGYGLMAWANIIAIALLAPKAVALLKDYEKQKKEGKDPAFDPKEFGIEDETGAWK
ncbi:MAG: alanine/glycine:cation symporter family protein [Eubacteriales bacterium]|nr:alanine/glycine:cation symporter family protein [Eubacteriales bacterium]